MPLVRVVEADDLPKIVETYPKSIGAPVNRHIERFDLQQNGDVTCFAAWDGTRPVGYVFVLWPGGSGDVTEQGVALGCAEISDLSVSQDARGQGIGRMLMETAEALVKSRGVRILGLEVTATNPYQDVARKLYKNLDYEDAGFGEFMSGYTYWDADGNPHRDEEPYRYLIKRL